MYDNPRNSITILSPFSLEPSLIKITAITNNYYIEAFSVGTPISTTPFSIFPDPTKHIEINSSWGQIFMKIEGPLSLVIISFNHI